MAKIKLKIKPGDQKPFTRYDPYDCSGATASKRVFGGKAAWGGSTARIRGRLYRLGSDARQVPVIHDSGGRVGTRTVTLYGPPIQTLEEQAEAAQKARDARKQARAGRKAKAREQAAQARTQVAERPDPRQQARAAVREQPRAAERPRGDEETRAARERARAQEAEARERLRSADQARNAHLRARVPREQPVPQPAAAAEPARTPQARVPREQPRAIEPPRAGLQWLLRNPFARPEPDRQPEPAAARRHP
jgi:hypothetical protein